MSEFLDILYCESNLTVFNTRRGHIVGDDNYSKLNLCHYVGDDPEHVAWSRIQLLKELDENLSGIIVPRQTHSTNVKVVTTIEDDLEGVDGVITKEKGLIIGVSTADCVPLLMADKAEGVIAAVHAGWRGAVGGIVQNAINVMKKLNVKPERIKCWMGPCICEKCFEVGEEVASQFPEVVINRTYEKPHVDLALYIEMILIELGVKKTNIEKPKVCTHCNPSEYFSARTHSIKSGRIYSGIYFKD